ncbi:AraC family transcriptional regulator [Bradyrhizobium sp.]|uniref:AraC family transcriptional regulator n=1 Tax=Bradyrhizobium sp. TaxID=376 RepID=UPI00262364F5|nr:AraC family transcriptional regulator [Bradyrhizobium sp.]
MHSQHSADPLRRFPVFKTSSSEDFRHALLTRFGASRVELKTPANLSARGNLVELESIGLAYGQSSNGASVDYPEAERFRLLTAVVGNGQAAIGRRMVVLDQNQSCIVSPGQEINLAVEAGHEWLNLRIDPGAFENKLAYLLGARPGGKLEFATAANRNSARFEQLWRLIRFFAEQLDTDSDQLPPLVLRELEQTILVSFLCTNLHTFSDLLQRDPADTLPSHVRRAEEFIEAHWNQAITIEKLVEATGTGARAIFRAFQQARGYSPMAFAKMVRLKRARQLLSTPDTETSVTSVAFVCGFGNLGHFARDYRRAFGERPSETLGKAMRHA